MSKIKRFGRRSLALFLSLVMAVGLLQATALAADRRLGDSAITHPDDGEVLESSLVSYSNAAKSETKLYKLTYQKNGFWPAGIPLPSSRHLMAGAILTLDSSVPKDTVYTGQFPNGSTGTKYQFVGWSLTKNSKTHLGETFTMPAADVTLYAVWDNSNVTSQGGFSLATTEFPVRWVTGYGSNQELARSKVLSVLSDGTAVCPSYPNSTLPTREAPYIFDGWSAPVKETENSQVIYTITAKWATPDVLEDPIESKKPGGGDGVADYHQFHVTYEVQNGTLTFNGTTGKDAVTTVITRRDDAGNPAGELGTAKLAVAHLATSNPDPNFGNAKWYVKATGTEGLGTETEAPAVGTVVPYHKDGTTYTVVYIKVNVTANPNGGSWQSSLPENWKGTETTGSKASELNNGSVTLPAAANITKDGKTLAGWKGSDGNDYAPGAEVRPDRDLTVTAQWAGLEITKTADPTSGVVENGTITYTITVKNTGDVDLTGVTVTDPMMPDSVSGVIGNLAAGHTSTAITYTHTVTAAEVAAGQVTNTATVEGSGPNGAKPTATSGEIVVKTGTVPPPPQITGMSKSRVTDTATITGLGLSGINTDTPVVLPAGGTSVTLLYAITVTGEAEAAYTVTDDGAVPVNGNSLTGTIPAGETSAVIYVTKSFTKDSLVGGKLVNTASVNGLTPDADDTVETEGRVEEAEVKKITVTWVDGLDHTTIDSREIAAGAAIPTPYPTPNAHSGYTHTGWSEPVTDSSGITITAIFAPNPVVDPDGPSYEALKALVKVQVVCDTNAAHETRSVELKADSYHLIKVNSTAYALTIIPEYYQSEDVVGSGHSFVGIDNSTLTLVLEPAGDPDAQSGSSGIPDSEEDAAGGDAGDTIEETAAPDDADESESGEVIAESSNDSTEDRREEHAADSAVKSEEIGEDEEDTVEDDMQVFSAFENAFAAPGRWIVPGSDTVTVHVRCEAPAPQPDEITVTWMDGYTNSPIEQATINRGSEIPAYPPVPDHESAGYEFTDWSVSGPDGESNITITANYRQITYYTVTFISRGITVADGRYRPGQRLTLPVDPASYYVGDYRYDFVRWTPAVELIVNRDATYTAVFEPTYVGEGPVVPVLPVTPVTPVTPTPAPAPIPDTPTPLDPGTDIPDEDVPLAGAVGLNDVDHFAYVIGYDDDTVRPLNNITRAEAATIFFRLMTDDYRSANWSASNDFSDVKAGDWYNNAISTCANAGALNGYNDGSFKPNASITRAEFAAIAARFLSDEYTDDGTGDFSDTANHWAAKEIRLAAKAGWIRGDGNTFRPNDYITRAEVMAIVNRMLDRTPDKDHMLPEMKKWVDNTEDKWYYADVQEATNEHDYERDETAVETWTLIKEHRDWAALELGWTANNGASETKTETLGHWLPDGI